MDSSSPTGDSDFKSAIRQMAPPSLDIPHSNGSSIVRSPLVKSVTSPVFAPSIKQASTFKKPSGCALVSALECNRILENKDIIVLDLRTYSEYSKSSIRDSIHVGLPSTLLRRKNFDFNKLVQNLPVDDRVRLENKMNAMALEAKKLSFLIYDNTPNQTDASLSLPCYGVATKISEYRNQDERMENCGLYILNVGYSVFKLLFPDDVIESTETCLKNITECSAMNSPMVEHPDLFIPMPHNINTSGEEYIRQTVNGLSFSPSLASTATKSPSISGSSINNSMTNSNDFSLESPVSTSSPISALFKFQLPNRQQLASPVFKLPQNEEALSLEDYISAVNARKNQENRTKEFKFQSFEFPKKHQSAEYSTRSPNEDKLNFQRKYAKLCTEYNDDLINEVIPQWFQELVTKSKVEIISQFQKLDYLERRRLNKSISKHKSTKSALTTISRPELSKMTPIDEKSFDFNSNKGSMSTQIKRKKSQKRSYSQPNCSYLKSDWKCCIDVDDMEDEHDIEISSGVELGVKNRYKDIFPFENTRVKLKRRSVSSLSSSQEQTPNHSRDNSLVNKLNDLTLTQPVDNYINANYIELPSLPNTLSDQKKELLKNLSAGKGRNCRYIATQAPMKTTVHDFYTCLLNNKVPIILSLTDTFENGIEKCVQYWEDGDYEGFKVKLLEEIEVPKSYGTESEPADKDNKNDIVLRRINIEYDEAGCNYEVIQIQIRNWPDLGVLTDPTNIIQIIHLKNSIIDSLFERKMYQPGTRPTVLVHCSAGCGRTGTWCTIDSVISNLDVFEVLRNELQVEMKGKVYDPISWTINTFRKQRISMVQNVNQFLFIYDSLVCYFSLCLENYGKKDILTKPLSAIYDQSRHIKSLNEFVDKKMKEVEPIFI